MASREYERAERDLFATGTDGQAVAREQARRSDGRFGARRRREADVTLSGVNEVSLGPGLVVIPGFGTKPAPARKPSPFGFEEIDQAQWEHIEAALIRSNYGETEPELTPTDRMRLTRLTYDMDHKVLADPSLRSAMPTCPGCGKAWGTGWRCRVCTNLYDEPLPLSLIIDAGLRKTPPPTTSPAKRATSRRSRRGPTRPGAR